MQENTVSKEKFGAIIYRMAKERAESPEGREELKGYSIEQFLDVLKKFTDVIDELPGEYTIHALYLTLNYLGSVVVSTIEHNKRALMQQTGGHA